MICLGLGTASGLPLNVPVLLRSIVQSYGSSIGVDANLVIDIKPAVKKIIDAGTDARDPWHEVTAYYRDFWNMPKPPVNGITPHIQYADIDAALAFHEHAVPRTIRPKIAEGDPALATTIQRVIAPQAKDCWTCLLNRQLASDALTGLQGLLYGKRARQSPAMVSIGVQTVDAVLPTTSTPKKIVNLGSLDLTSTPRRHNTPATHKHPIVLDDSCDEVPVKKTARPAPRKKIKTASSTTRPAAGDSLDGPSNVNTSSNVRTVAEEWEGLDFSAIHVASNVSKKTKPSPRAFKSQSAALAWDDIDFTEKASKDAALASSSTNIAPLSAPQIESFDAVTHTIRREMIDAWADLDFTRKDIPMDVDNVAEESEPDAEYVGSSSEEESESYDEDSDSEGDDDGTSGAQIALEHSLATATARYPLEAFDSIEASLFAHPDDDDV